MFRAIVVGAATLLTFGLQGVALSVSISFSSMSADWDTFSVSGGTVEFPPSPSVLGEYASGIVSSA